MKGKNKCKILKEIRQKIADENDIPYVTRECSYQGECRGTCPKCEAELRYLEQELEKRRRLGKTVAVAAVAASLSLSLTACVPGSSDGGEELGGETVPAYTLPCPTATEAELVGEPILLPDSGDGDILGMIDTRPCEPDPTEIEELLGDVVYLPGTPEDLPPEELPSESFATPEDLAGSSKP